MREAELRLMVSLSTRRSKHGGLSSHDIAISRSILFYQHSRNVLLVKKGLRFRLSKISYVMTKSIDRKK